MLSCFDDQLGQQVGGENQEKEFEVKQRDHLQRLFIDIEGDAGGFLNDAAGKGVAIGKREHDGERCHEGNEHQRPADLVKHDAQPSVIDQPQEEKDAEQRDDPQIGRIEATQAE